jgi:hypothetical protein
VATFLRPDLDVAASTSQLPGSLLPISVMLGANTGRSWSRTGSQRRKNRRSNLLHSRPIRQSRQQTKEV